MQEIPGSFKQVNGEFAFMEIALVAYQTAVHRLIKSVSKVPFDHVLLELWVIRFILLYTMF